MGSKSLEIGVEGRPKLCRQLHFHIQRVPAESLAIVGLPGFQPEKLFEYTLGIAIENGIRAVPLRIDSVRLRGLRPLLQKVLVSLSNEDEGLPDDLISLLRRLKESALRAFEDSGKPTIFALKNFHALSQTPSAYMEEMRQVLDFWQEAATEAPMWLAIWACSHLEPGRVCESVQWSPFYKIFGNRIYFASNLELEATLNLLETEIKTTKEIPDARELAARIFNIAGGVPDLIEFVLDRIGNDALILENIDRLAEQEVFLVDLRKEIVQRLGGDFGRLVYSDNWQVIDDAERSTVQRLSRFGLVTVQRDQWRFACKLLGFGPAAEDSCVAATTNAFVHGLWLLPYSDRLVIEKLCSDTYFTKLSILQHREGEARVLYAHREDDCGRSLRPMILKVHNRTSISKEINSMEQARGLLGPATPAVSKTEFSGGIGGYRADLASADSKEYSVKTYEQIFRESTERSSDVPERMLRRLFQKVLGCMYRDVDFKETPPSRWYYIPKVQEHSDLHDRFDVLAGENGNLRNTANEIQKEMPRAAAFSLDLFRKQVFESKHLLGISNAIHGDLNPRNFLMDGAENIYVIDFSTFGPGPMLKDFARVECETLLRLCPEVSLDEAAAMMSLLFSDPLANAAQRLALFPLREPIQIAVRCVSVVREIAIGYGRSASPPHTWNFDLDYLVGLAATSARLCLFKEYLPDTKANIAYLYASFALWKLTKLLELSS